MTAAMAIRGIQPGGSPNGFHCRSVVVLRAAEIPFLTGAAYVVEVYAGVSPDWIGRIWLTDLALIGESYSAI